jgi:hypothetical protein
MQKKSRLSAERTASMFHRADDGRKPSKFTPTPQLLALTSGGLLDIDSAADALAWGKRLEVEVGFWFQRRRRS